MAKSPEKFGNLPPSVYPGERLGMPQSGIGSVARLGRRTLALFADWFLAMLVTVLIPAPESLTGFVTLGVFALLQIVFITTLGGSPGHLLFGMRVVPLVGGWIGPWRPIVRTALLCLVIPVLVWDSDQRAFHDKIAGTVLMRY